MEKTVDARGMACPLPVVNAKKAAEEMKTGDVLVVLVDNEVAVQNLQRFAIHKGYDVFSEKRDDKDYEVVMTIESETAETLTFEEVEKKEEVTCNLDARKKGMTVVLSANVMGTGDEKLGKALMKAFLSKLNLLILLVSTLLALAELVDIPMLARLLKIGLLVELVIKLRIWFLIILRVV